MDPRITALKAIRLIEGLPEPHNVIVKTKSTTYTISSPAGSRTHFLIKNKDKSARTLAYNVGDTKKFVKSLKIRKVYLHNTQHNIKTTLHH